MCILTVINSGHVLDVVSGTQSYRVVQVTLFSIALNYETGVD